MAQDSRGGGYDLARNKEANAKKALGTQTQQNIGAMANARQIGADTAAPTSIGDLMTPSTFGREGPPVNEQDLAARTQRNESFLSDPATQAMLMQFGVKMLSGGNPGDAIRSALQMPARMAAAGQKAEEHGLDITNKKLDIMKKTKELAGGGAEKNPTDLLKLLQEADAAEANGDHATAATLRSKAYKDSTIVLESTGQVISPPGSVTGNAGVAPGSDGGGPTIITPAGSKADADAKALAAQVAQSKINTMQKGMLMGADIDNIGRILDSSTIPPNYSITGFGSNLKWISGTNAANVDSLINSIKARVTIQELQAMRDASKTGGALGQVSDYENKMLASTLSSLEQGQTVDQFRRNLATVKFLFDPAYLEKRGELAQALADKKITWPEAENQMNQMFRESLFGPDAVNTAAPIDLTVPPPYIEERFKPIWNAGNPQQKRALLNDEDKAKFDAMQQQQPMQ